MAKKTKPQGEQPRPGKASVKLDAELHRMARTVAAFHGQELADFLEQHLRPVVERLYREMGREIRGEG